MSNKKNKKYPVEQVIIFYILMALIFFGPFFKSFDYYVNIANYISMAIAVIGVLWKIIYITKNNRQRDIYKFVVLFFSMLIAFGAFIFMINLESPNTLVNNMFTLIALLFCLCDTLIEKKVIGLFNLEEKEEK